MWYGRVQTQDDTRGPRLHIGMTVVNQQLLQECNFMIQEKTATKMTKRMEKQSNSGPIKK